MNINDKKINLLYTPTLIKSLIESSTKLEIKDNVLFGDTFTAKLYHNTRNDEYLILSLKGKIENYTIDYDNRYDTSQSFNKKIISQNDFLETYRLKNLFGVTSKDAKLLTEAYRRYFMFKDGKPLKNEYLGLGTNSQYDSKYFIQADGNTEPKTTHWWILTDEGVEIMNKIIQKFPIPKNIAIKRALSEVLFSK